MPSLSAANPSNPSELGVRENFQPQKRQRVPVGNLFSMPRGKALVWLPGDEAPRVSSVKGYFDIPKLAARADLNPYYKPPAAARYLQDGGGAAPWRHSPLLPPLSPASRCGLGPRLRMSNRPPAFRFTGRQSRAIITPRPGPQDLPRGERQHTHTGMSHE